MLSFEKGDATWERLRERGRKDFYFFCSTILGYEDLFDLREETHLLPLNFVARTTGIPDIDTAPIQLILWPRDTGKTSCGTVASAIWEAIKNPDIAILIANEKQENANDFLGTIKRHFESNELLRALYPEVLHENLNDTTWSAERATIKRNSSRPEPTFDTTGVGGSKVGRHYDLIICDDLIAKEAMEAARSGNWKIMDKVKRWTNQLRPMLSHSAKPFPAIRFIGTIWWLDDVYDHIEKAFTFSETPRRYLLRAKLPNGTITTRECYRAGDLAVMRISAIEDGRATFPTIWPLEEIAKLRQIDPDFVNCNLLNSPSDPTTALFKEPWLRYWTSPDAGRLIVFDRDDGSKRIADSGEFFKLMTVDPAFTTRQENDRAAYVVLATDTETGKHIVLEARAQHIESKDLVDDIITTAQRHKVPKILVEAAGQQAAFISFLQNEILRRGVDIFVDTVSPGGRAKDVRIETLAAYFKAGQIVIHASQTELIEEYRAFRPQAARKDTLDALAYAIENAPRVVRGGGSGTNPAEFSRLQLATYRARRRMH